MSATDKASLKREAITITNDKGRLSQREIDEMVRDTALFEDEDRQLRERVEARTALETAAYALKTQLSDPAKLRGRLDADDRLAVEAAVREAILFLDENPSAERAEYDQARETLRGATDAIVRRAAEQADGGDAAASTEDL